MKLLSKAEGTELLQIARAAIEKRNLVTSLSQKTMGLFVTLNVDDQIRGCMGDPFPTKPLDQLVKECTLAACDDSRYEPIKEDELDRLVIELSVLTPPKPIQLDEIEVGRHGLIIEKGLILPQVAKEQRWDIPTFIKRVCKKAGLCEDACNGNTKLLGFEAEIFRTETRVACHSR